MNKDQIITDIRAAVVALNGALREAAEASLNCSVSVFIKDGAYQIDINPNN